MVGSLLYASNTTRVDIAYAVQQLSQGMSAPCVYHVLRAKRCMRYLQGTRDRVLVFGRNSATAPILNGYCDSDWAGDADSKSITGNLLYCYGSLIGWLSKKQTIIAQSSCEAEYNAITTMSNNVMWGINWLNELFNVDIIGVPVFSDSQAAIALAANVGISPRTKHIAVRVHLIRSMVKEGLIKLLHVATEKNLSDILTKPLPKEQFGILTEQLLIQ